MDKLIPKYLPPRPFIPVKNKYYLTTNVEDFHVVLYYINPNKASLVVRNLESEAGWIYNLQLKILSNNEEEIINIGKYDNNYMHLDIETKKVILEPTNINNHQLIPKRIIQTFPKNKAFSLIHYNTIMTFIELNPEYEYYFYDDKRSEKFIKDNFSSDIFKAYKTLDIGKLKSELFRLCYLYLYGGCYVDCKFISKFSLRDYIESNDKFIITQDQNNNVYPGLIITVPKNQIILDAIKSYVNIILQRDYSNITHIFSSYSLTNSVNNSPKDVQIKFKYILPKIIDIKTNEEIIPGFNIDYFIYPHISYTVAFNEKKIYNNDIFLDNYTIKVYPYSSSEKFDFYIEDNKIKVIRTDSTNGWNLELKIKLINNITNEEKDVMIGSSDHNIKIVNINSIVIGSSENDIKSVGIISNEKKIQNAEFLDKYTIKVYPYPFPDRFDFSIEGDKIRVKRLYSPTGWGQQLKIRLIDNFTNEEKDVMIGSSDHNIKIVDINSNAKKIQTNVGFLDKYTIKVYPYPFPDRFDFSIEGDKIRVKRLDSPTGWGQQLKIRLIDNFTNEEKDVMIGSSDHNIKIVDINSNAKKIQTNVGFLDKYTIKVYPYPFPDRFDFSIEGDKIRVKRLDSPTGWGQQLKIRLIDIMTNEEKDVMIGSSDHNVKIVKI
ncbi:MAG: glycosyltransferase [Candidatus Micrarchaeaceae archaeon]